MLRRLIEDGKTIDKMWSEWSSTWLAKNLEAHQIDLPYAKKSSIFNAFIKQNYGGKLFVTAVWLSGCSWMSDFEIPFPDSTAATTVAERLVQWLSLVLDAIAAHKAHPDAREAQRRSGKDRGYSGLNWAEQKMRKQRKRAERNLDQAHALYLCWKAGGIRDVYIQTYKCIYIYRYYILCI